MTYLRIKRFNAGKPILFGLNAMKVPFSVTAKAADLLADSEGQKGLPEGMFIVGTGSEVRFLPRARTTAATTTSGGTARNVSLKAPCNQFKIGDVLYAQAGYAEVTFSGTFATGNTFVVRVGQTSYTGTVGATQTAAGAIAAFVTEHAAALLVAGTTVSAKGNALVVFSQHSSAIATFSTAPAVTLSVSTTAPGFLGDNIAPIGAISSISAPASNGNRTAVLVADAAYVVPVGCAVGVLVDEYLGIYPDPLDFTDTPTLHVAPIQGADGVYEQNLPYIDESIKRALPLLNIIARFFKYV